MVAIITHAVFYKDGEIYGPADAVSNFLAERKIPHHYLKNPLWDSYRSKLIHRIGKRKTMRDIGPNIGGLLRYPIDVFLTVTTFWNLERPAIIIGVDPLNCIGAIILKGLNRTESVVYFTADFAIKRFDNPVLNRIYHWLDGICSKYADYSWSVSSRIVEYRRNQGVPEDKNLLIPNAPAFSKIKRLPLVKVDPFTLVIVSNLKAGVEFEEIFKAVKELRKKHRKVRLVIIGGGPGEKEVRDLIHSLQLDDAIDVLGQLPHETVHQVLSKAGIGIALYNDTAAWRYFSDSMKARDYMACGLPVLISGDLATVDDIVAAGAGMAIVPEQKQIVKAVDTLLGSPKVYKQYRDNAIAFARKNDIDKIIEQAMAKLPSA